MTILFLIIIDKIQKISKEDKSYFQLNFIILNK